MADAGDVADRTAPDDRDGWRPGSRIGLVAGGTVVLLCLVVAGVGGVAVAAELSSVWGSYFFMERAIAAATPVALVLAGAAVVAGLAAVARTPR